MRTTSRLTSFGVVLLLMIGCMPPYRIRTMASPDARFATLRTFMMLATPARHDPSPGATDPMVGNQIARDAIGRGISDALLSRGYALGTRDADFGVAFYASVPERLYGPGPEVGYPGGYPGAPGWPRYPRPAVATYREGTLVIDVVNLATRDLLWRGEGRTQLTDDPEENVKELTKVARAIVDRFPRPIPRVMAER